MSCVPEPTTETLTLLQEALTRIADFTVADTRQNQMALVSMTEEVERLCGKLLPITVDELKELDESNLSVKKKYETYKGTILSILRLDAGCTLSTIALKLHRAVLDSELFKNWESLHTYSAMSCVLSVFSLMTRFYILFSLKKYEDLKVNLIGDGKVFIYIASNYVKKFNALALENKTNKDLFKLPIFVLALACAIKVLGKEVPIPDEWTRRAKFIRKHLDRSIFNIILDLYETSSDLYMQWCCVTFLCAVVESGFDINCVEYEKCIERMCFFCTNSLLCNAGECNDELVKKWFKLLETVIDKAICGSRYLSAAFHNIQQNGVWSSLSKYVSSERPTVAVAAIACAGGILLGSTENIEPLVHTDLCLHLTVALYSNDRLVIKQALWLLSNLAADCAKFVDIFVDYDWLPIILHHIRAKISTVTIEGVWVLRNLLKEASDDHIVRFLNIDMFVETIRMSLYAPQERMQPSKNADWQYLELLEECLSVLWVNPEARKVLMELNVQHAVKYVMEEKSTENYDIGRVASVRNGYSELYAEMAGSYNSDASSVTS